MEKADRSRPRTPTLSQSQFESTATAARWTFIIGKVGMIAYKNIKVIPAQDAKAIAEFLGNASKK